MKEKLLNRDFKTTKPNEKWVTDITYLIHNNKRAYLSAIMDLYTKNIIAYNISYYNNNLVIQTLNEAIQKQKDVSGIILHF
ncbi:MAG: DDE-type integrase/transposase/recombinase [Bacilli bacterium]